MAKFRVGDVVRLKSGGPKMTIEDIKPDRLDWFYRTKDFITCIWYDRDGTLRRETFEDKVLEEARD